MISASDTNELIAFIVNKWPPRSETFIVNEIRGIRASGTDVAIFALNSGNGPHVSNCPVYYRRGLSREDILQGWEQWSKAFTRATALTWTSPRQWLYAVRNLPTALGFAQLARSLGASRVHGHFAHTPTDIAVMMGRSMGVPVSCSAHAWDVYCTGRSLYRRLAAVDLCVTCTEAARSHILSRATQPVGDNITVIHHGIDLQQFPFQPTCTPSAPLRIVAVGRLVLKKGFGHLLHACRRLKEQLRFQCTIAGDGPLKSDLQAKINEMPLDDHVDLAGHIPHEQISDLYAEADILVVPSVIAPDQDRDGLPNVILEAMASGLPVVASELSGIPEAVTNGETGLLVPPGKDAELADAIQRMGDDNSLRRRIIHRAREVIETDFNYLDNAEQMYQTLTSV